MKRSWTAFAVMLVALFLVAGCNDYGNTFQNNTGALLSFISPQQVAAGSGKFSMLMSGSGFVAQTIVFWNGQKLPTHVTLDSNNNVLTLTADVDASLVAKPGVATVYTQNPFSGAGNNGLSNSVFFTINPPANPAPVISSIGPLTAVAGGASFPLTIIGPSPTPTTGFLPTTDPTGGSIVRWSAGSVVYSACPPPAIQPNCPNQGITTASISATQIVVTIGPSLIASAGTASVTVSNPPAPPPAGCITNCNGGGGGGSSNAVTFTVCPTTQPACPPAAAAKNGSSAAAATVIAEETPAVSLDGRFVGYTALQNDRAQIFLRDTCEGAASGCQPRTTLLSVAADGTPANDESHTPSMSSDGRFVAFSSIATNLVENAPAGRQVYLRDTCAGAAASCTPSTQLISTDLNGALVGSESILPSVSSSGRFIAFLSITPSPSANKSLVQTKPLLTDSKNSGYRQVFVRDTCLGVASCTAKTTRISLQPGDGTESDAKPAGPSISGSASHVAITSGNAASLFTRSVAVDDRVFLAITRGKP